MKGLAGLFPVPLLLAGSILAADRADTFPDGGPPDPAADAVVSARPGAGRGTDDGDLAGATRELPEGCFGTSEVVGVTLHIWVTNPPPSGLIVGEQLPAGWTVTDALWNGDPMAPSYIDGEYRWLFGIGHSVASGTLTYNTRTAGQTGDLFAITGTLRYGSSTTVTTLGDQDVLICRLPDTDHDGMPDEWETAYGLCPTNPADAYEHWDSDTLSNLEEYQADTNPTNSRSTLRMLALVATGGTVCVRWEGGVWATQYIERAEGLAAGGSWTCRQVVTPPTDITNAWSDADPATATSRYYRVRAAR